MLFKKTHKMIFTEMADFRKFLYRNGLLIMILDKLEHQLQLSGNLPVCQICPLIGDTTIKQEEKMI